MTVVSMMVPSEQGPAAMAVELANSLVELLESARRNLDGDQEAARASIVRAASLLRVALDRSAHGEGEIAAPGTLAGWQIHRVKAFIDNHLEHTIHIKDLAAVAQRSTAYFCRAFKRTFGETPHAFIIRRRLIRAGHLMLASDLALSEIAVSCGFTDQAHLSKLFRQRNGQSPAVWRRERRAVAGETAVFPAPAPSRYRVPNGALLALG
jgi:AraC family transcriptional regulator